jgi:hypothetical protein
LPGSAPERNFGSGLTDGEAVGRFAALPDRGELAGGVGRNVGSLAVERREADRYDGVVSKRPTASELDQLNDVNRKP